MNELLNAKKILEKYNQEHLLYFYDSLPELQKILLINQILNIDFENILSLYNKSFNNETLSLDSLTPLEHIKKDKLSESEITFFSNIGDSVLKENSLAVVTMAGGQGTRLRL